MTLSVVKEDNRFRTEWQGNSTDWLPDTPSNRKAMLVFLRLLLDEEGKQLFTFQELSVLFDSDNRQASSQHMEDFRECGSTLRSAIFCLDNGVHFIIIITSPPFFHPRLHDLER